MYKSLLFASLAVTPLPLYALDTRQAPTEQLLKLGNELGASAGSSQWQQLWYSVREAGYLQAHATQVHFTVPATLLPELARQTLAQADQVHAVKQTRALYRRDFPDRIIGKRAEHAFRAVPAGRLARPAPRHEHDPQGIPEKRKPVEHLSVRLKVTGPRK